MPKISFVMPAYNVVEWIAESISGLLSQTEPDIEIVIVDDCSTDGTGEFLDEWASQFSRVKIIHNKKQMGAGRSRNIGMEAASSEIIGVCDADDVYPTERAELTLKHFQMNPKSELVNFPNIQIDYYNGRHEEFPGEDFDHETYLKNGKVNYFCNPSAAFKKASAVEVGGYEPEFEKVKETDDSQFVRKWVTSGKKIDFQPGYVLCFHRLRPDSMMTKLRGFDPAWVESK